MEKQIKIYDYAGEPTEVVIKDFENVVYIECEVLSGDEVLTVVYKNGDKKIFDSSSCRMVDYNDGYVSIPLDQVDKISDFPYSYDMMDYFWGLESATGDEG